MFKRIVVPLALLALAFACIAVQYHAGIPMQASLFNSDGMYLPILFSDLFAHGGRIRDWYLTPAPYFFPDYPLYAVAYLVSEGAFNQFLAFGLLQLAAAAAAIGWIARTCRREHATLVAVLVVTALGWLAVRPVEPFIFALASAFHFGAFLGALLFVALWLQREQHARRWQLPCMCAITFLCTLSDSLFTVQAVAPFLLTCALVRRAPRPFAFRAVLPHAAVLAAALLGIAAYKLVRHPTRPPTMLGLEHFARNAHALGQALTRVVEQVPVLGVVIGVYLAVGLACIVRVVPTRAFGSMPRPLLLLLVFSLAAMAGNLAAMLLLTNLVVNPRYIIAALTWPLVVTAILLAHWRAAWFSATSLSVVAMVVGLLGADAWAAVRRTGAEPAGYPSAVACIDQALATADVHNGIAGYWDAKWLQALSKHRLTVAQHMGNLSEHPWITSARYFRPAYDFAIVSNNGGDEYVLPVARLIALNGPPAHTATCGGYTVLVYGQDRLRVQAVATSTAQQAP